MRSKFYKTQLSLNKANNGRYNYCPLFQQKAEKLFGFCPKYQQIQNMQKSFYLPYRYGKIMQRPFGRVCRFGGMRRVRFHQGNHFVGTGYDEFCMPRRCIRARDFSCRLS